jgi:hypothetical protein
MVASQTRHFESIYLSDDLASYDPYDVWKTRVGLRVKNTFNKSKLLGAGPALVLSIWDQFLNNKSRLGYTKQEYPIVRALAAQTSLVNYLRKRDLKFLSAAEKHLDWLAANASKGYSGLCWGLGFKWPAASNIVYDANTPHATHTPYALEAMHLYTEISGHDRFVPLIKSCFQFFERDLCVLYEDDNMIATSYGPFKDRIVTNAVSYVMYAYAIFTLYFPERREYITTKVQKLYNFISAKQLQNGSWFYIPDNRRSFIDCFHSCFILKNLIKTQKMVTLNKADELIQKGYSYLRHNFYDSQTGLYKRFSEKNKPTFIKFDLYDNAEMLNVLNLLHYSDEAIVLKQSMLKHFFKGNDIYSNIDFLGIKRNKNTLRWAVMPFLFVLTTLE